MSTNDLTEQYTSGLSHSVDLSVRYIPGKRDVMADNLSRQGLFRMVTASGCSRKDFSSMGKAISGPLCDQMQQKTRGILFIRARSVGHGRRCPSDNLMSTPFPPFA